MSTWKADRDWADRHWPQVEAAVRRVAGQIISVTPAECDEDRAGRDHRVDCGETAFISIPIHDIIATPRVLIDADLHTPANLVRRGGVHPVLPCPQCRTVAYTAGPQGMPQRRCWRCDLVWTPGEETPRRPAT